MRLCYSSSCFIMRWSLADTSYHKVNHPGIGLNDLNISCLLNIVLSLVVRRIILPSLSSIYEDLKHAENDNQVFVDLGEKVIFCWLWLWQLCLPNQNNGYEFVCGYFSYVFSWLSSRLSPPTPFPLPDTTLHMHTLNKDFIFLNLTDCFSPKVPLSLAIRVTSLRGTLRLHIKPPPSDQLWFAFTSMPDIDFNLESSVGERKITNGHIALFLVSRLKVWKFAFFM